MTMNASGGVKKCLIRYCSIHFDTGKWNPKNRCFCNLPEIPKVRYPQIAAQLLRKYDARSLMLKGRRMIIVCSWCRKEGKNEFVGEKGPLDDQRETHGICVIHRQQVQTRWREAVRITGSSRPDGSRTNVVLSALQHWSDLIGLTRNRDQ